MWHGLLNLSLLGYITTTLIMIGITFASVQIYLHYHLTHHDYELPLLFTHFFRFWLWLTTGMITRNWVLMHIQIAERKADPQGPIVIRLMKLMSHNSLNADEKISQEKLLTPIDWIERNIYSNHSTMGLLFMFLMDVLLFGIAGIIIWVIQLVSILGFASGIIKGWL